MANDLAWSLIINVNIVKVLINKTTEEMEGAISCKWRCSSIQTIAYYTLLNSSLIEIGKQEWKQKIKSENVDSWISAKRRHTKYQLMYTKQEMTKNTKSGVRNSNFIIRSYEVIYIVLRTKLDI